MHSMAPVPLPIFCEGFMTVCLLAMLRAVTVLSSSRNIAKQELSYRKQIARKLRIQYVDGIYDNPVTLKSRLRFIEGQLKRNHWIDHTRFSSS